MTMLSLVSLRSEDVNGLELECNFVELNYNLVFVNEKWMEKGMEIVEFLMDIAKWLTLNIIMILTFPVNGLNCANNDYQLFSYHVPWLSDAFGNDLYATEFDAISDFDIDRLRSGWYPHHVTDSQRYWNDHIFSHNCDELNEVRY